jgi:predicted transposase/invertase (TIGR01784 family)
MKHHIDPKVDCVFKALLGSDENKNLLIHFLNAILGNDLTTPITWVEILNPYNDKEFLSDKLSIVDVKARDEQQHLYQVEIQLLNRSYLPERIVYNWADIYSQQLHSGDDYTVLKPTYSIWLLAENLLKNDSDYVHCYKLRDEKSRVLTDGGIWLLELAKFSTHAIHSEEQRWLQFFKEGEQLDDSILPDWMSTNEMRQAMTILSVFSEKERAYFQYQARQEYLREQRMLQRDLEKLDKLQKSEQAALQREQLALQREQQALLEIERLKALLNKQS